MNIAAPDNFQSLRIPSPASIRIFLCVFIAVFMHGCASQKVDPFDETETQKGVISNTSLGMEYMERGQYEVALGKLKKAIKEDPNYAPAQTVIAVLYERIGEKDLAGKHYKKAYEADPTDGDVNNNYGVYLCQTGKVSQAMEHFRKAPLDPFYATPAIALSNAGSCALRAGDFTAADQYLRSALKIEPDLPDALITMARLSYEQQNYLSARAFMQRYEVVAKHDADTLLLAYRMEMATNNRKGANKYKILLESNFPDSNQTAEARRLSAK